MFGKRYLLLLMLILTLAAVPALAQSSLTETYASPDERLTLRYPEGWVVVDEDDGIVVLATDDSLAEGINQAIPAGEAALALFFSDTDPIAEEDIFDEGTPASVVRGLIGLIQEDSENAGRFSNPVAITVGERSGARSTGTVEGNDVLLVATDMGDDVFGVAVGITAGGDLERFESKLLAIIESINYALLTPVEVNLDELVTITPQNAGQLERLWSVTPHSGAAYAVAISPDGRMVASCGADGSIVLLDAASGQELRTLTGHRDEVGQVLFSPDGQRLASLSNDGTVRLWDVATGEAELTFTHGDPVFYMAYSPGGRWIAYSTYALDTETSAYQSSTVWLADVQDEQNRELMAVEGNVLFNSFAFDADSNTLMFSAYNGEDTGEQQTQVWLWDIERDREINSETRPGNPIDVFFTPTGRPYVTMNDPAEPNDVLLWDVEENYIQHTLTGYQNGTYHVVLNLAGTIIGAASYDGTVRLWELASGDELAVLNHEGQAYGVAFSDDGRLVATSGDQGSVALWGIAD
jgi:Tol biopolymer transport system component